ncbi:LysR family transcriptional regulator [Solimonas soli]|uniref:LysR family transcriptional regulator n=1 Tax=Solimonas soli TaxID=413479 RepID=UPI0004826C10|nr:LysR family transcriptional regulator [Solimonas soli]
MDAIQTYAAFVRACESGSFSAVAQELGISQSSISKQIANLESTLGVQLFARTTRRLTPTTEALRLYEHARQLLDAVEEIRFSKDRPAAAVGMLRVTMPHSFGRRRIVPLLGRFLERHPQVQLDIVLDDNPLDLVEEGIELGIRLGPLASSTLVARPIGIAEQYLVASLAYIARAGTPETPQDLANHRCLLNTATRRSNRWEFESEHGRSAVEIAGQAQANDPEALYDMVLAGLGIALIPDWLLDRDIEEGRVLWLLRDYYPTPQPVNIVYSQTRFPSQRARSFIEFLLEELRGTR